MPPKDMKAKAINPTVMKVIPKPRSGGGTSLYLSFSRIPAKAAIARAQPTPQPNSVNHRLRKVVISFLHEQRTAHDGAVHRDQRKEDSQRVVKRRKELIEEHLQDLNHRRDHADVADEAQEREIDRQQNSIVPVGMNAFAQVIAPFLSNNE